MRVDNGAPWATWADLPPAFALWLIGLGVKPIWNHPHCPKENPKVERCNGLVGTWGDPAACADFARWQAHLAHVVVVQREQYRGRDGRTRREAYPQLETTDRRYTTAQEATQFDLGRVKEYLAQGRWPRLVSKIGQITLYGKAYRVGRRWVGEQVWLRLDATTGEWVICAKDGEEVIRHPADQITTDRIMNLQVAHPRPPSKRKKRQNLTAPPPT
jgi:hypothetical protein